MVDHISDVPFAEDKAAAPVRKRSPKGQGQSNAQRQKAFRERRKALLDTLGDDTELLQVKAALAVAKAEIAELQLQLEHARSQVTQLRAAPGKAASAQ